MGVEPLVTLSIRKLASLLRRRKLSPVELTEATLKSIERENPRLNAYLCVTADQALESARQAERAISGGDYRSPLHGIPIALKDLFYTRGIRTTAGSKIMAGFVPDYDATVVERLRAAGAVMVGKTNLHELAYGITNNNPHYGPVHNPWGLEHIPGGSSGGSGAAVAASLCSAALGTDTGGSIRIPATYCGIVGLKPTYGLVSRHGVVALGMTLDHVGPMAKCAWDAGAVLREIAGPDARDEHSASPQRPDDCLAGIETGIQGLVVGVPENYYFDHLNAEVNKAVRGALAVIEGLGARLDSVRIPSAAEATELARTTLLAEAAALHQKELRLRAQEIGPDVRALLQQGEGVPASDYINAQQARKQFRNELAALFQRVDVIATPTSPITAPRIGETTVRINLASEDARLATTRLVRAINFAGVPALSMPCGFDHAGLPIGMQLIGKPLSEGVLLRVAHAYESATDWTHSHPSPRTSTTG